MNISNCEQCGAEIKRRGKKIGRFCSFGCKAEWQKTQKPVDEAWLRQKYLDEKLSTYDIGKIVNRDPKQVHNWLVGYGIPTRPRGENLANGDSYMSQSDAIPTFLGKKHRDETRKILSEKAQVKKPWLRGENNGMSGRVGKTNPHYIDGSSPERQRLYASGAWKEILRTVYARDGYHCKRCGAPKTQRKGLHAHHIKPWAGNPSLRFDPNNIVTLCRSCHEWVHSRENVGKEYLD